MSHDGCSCDECLAREKEKGQRRKRERSLDFKAALLKRGFSVVTYEDGNLGVKSDARIFKVKIINVYRSTKKEPQRGQLGQ